MIAKRFPSRETSYARTVDPPANRVSNSSRGSSNSVCGAPNLNEADGSIGTDRSAVPSAKNSSRSFRAHAGPRPPPVEI